MMQLKQCFVCFVLMNLMLGFFVTHNAEEFLNGKGSLKFQLFVIFTSFYYLICIQYAYARLLLWV